LLRKEKKRKENKNYKACNFVMAYHDKNAIYDSIIQKDKNHK